MPPDFPWQVKALPPLWKSRKRRSAVSASFVIDTLTYLSRGGRCNSVTALLANTLKLKPEIVVKDGAMIVAKNTAVSLAPCF